MGGYRICYQKKENFKNVRSLIITLFISHFTTPLYVKYGEVVTRLMESKYVSTLKNALQRQNTPANHKIVLLIYEIIETIILKKLSYFIVFVKIKIV